MIMSECLRRTLLQVRLWATETPSSWTSIALAALLVTGLTARPAFCSQTDSPQESAAADEMLTESANSAEDLKHFETAIRPILVRHCYQCHSSTAAKSESGLRLDSRDALRTGGDRGPAIVPGKPEESLLLQAISHSDPDLQMPPKKDRLSAAILRDFEIWIRNGAVDPRDESDASQVAAHLDMESAREFWSWKKPVRPTPPEVADPQWPTSDIDAFVLQKLSAAGLKPSPDAEPATLLRRLHFDLIGLPPTPDDAAQFLTRISSDGFETALAAETDRLLASSQFGERWGRHWLDVVRFAESSGKEANISYPYAWRYRDYVFDSLNEDLPFDRFLTEQVAGDLLPAENNAERARLLIATGFLAVGAKNLDEADRVQFEADVIDEQIDALGRAVLANSIACARCHDHKFDPFTMEDYYALAGIFSSTKTFYGTWVSPANRIGGDPLVLPPVDGQKIFHPGIPAKKVTELKAQLAALQKEQRDGMAAVYKAVQEGRDASEIFTLRDALRILWTSGGIEGSLEKVDDDGKPLPLAMGVQDRRFIMNAPLLESGDVHKRGRRIPRGFPKVMQLENPPTLTSVRSPWISRRPMNVQSGRLQLAQWLTHSDNPLTARVMANRVWHYLLGAGIVRSVDNFGMSGEPPSHPELLDLLAIHFVEDGWSIKKLVRRIVLSRTYRQSSAYDANAFVVDPDNRLLWRIPKRRLDAECIRDAMLAVAGELELVRPEGSLVAKLIGDRPISLIGLDKKIPDDLDHSLHRSVYLPVLRDRLPDVLDLFDFAEPSLVTGARETTNVPLQALYLMNSPFVTGRAKALAARMRQESSQPELQIRHACQLCYGRDPDSAELTDMVAFLAHPPVAEPANSLDQLEALCQALLVTAEFRIVD